MRIDPVTVQILRNRVGGLMEEMAHRFFRSGYSTIVRESRDFSCVIVDAKGRLIASPPMFYHATAYYYLAQKIIALYGDDLRDDDMFVANHPYEAYTPHAPDMALMAPIVSDGVLVGFAAAIAHKADIGGTVPGSSWGQAVEIFQEGFHIPPMRLYEAGVLNADMERLIAANSRQPRLVLGDLRAQAGAVRVGRERMQALAREHGARTLVEALDAMIEAAGREMASAFAKLPDGEHEAEGFLDVENGDPVRLHVRARVAQGRVAFDFSGTSPQTRAPINLRPALVEACCFHALIALIDPSLRYSDAARALVEINAPPGSAINALSPAPCSSYMKSCQRLIDVLIEALNPFCPARAAANAGGSGGSIFVTWGQGSGPDARLTHHNQHEIFGSAYGGGRGCDGASGTTVHLSNIYVTPIEIVETEFPTRVTRFELIPDSGGDGQWRGGLSFRREYVVDQPAVILYRGDKSRYPACGSAGGEDGRRSRFLVDPGGPDEKEMPANCRVELKPGQRFRVEAAGGGGYGDPAKRDPEARERDIEDGYVTRKA
jgi:N-methylhydantoinase B